MTWEEILEAIRVGKVKIPTATNGVPLVSINAPVFELMELLEALTTGYNQQVDLIKHLENKMFLMRNLVRQQFPASRKTDKEV